MNGFWGADTEALRTMGAVLSRRATALADLESALSATIDSLEWDGEDAERFRADWSRVGRAGLQDQEFELRLQARRLGQHADAQDEASAPDGWGFGGGWSSPGEFLRDVFRRAEDLLGDLLGGGASGLGGSGGQDGSAGPLEALLREVLSTPEGRAAFLGAFLGSALGGLLADLVSRAIGLGQGLENLLTGLGPAAGLSDLIGASTAGPAGAVGGEAGESGASGAGGGAGAGAAAAGEGSTPGGGEGGADSSSGAGGGGGGSTGGSGSGGSGGGDGGASASDAAGADAAPSDVAGGASAETGGGEASNATSATSGLQATAEGPAQSAGGGAHSPREVGDEGPTSLLERLLEMLGDAMGHGGDASSVGDDIGSGGIGTGGAGTSGAGTSGAARR